MSDQPTKAAGGVSEHEKSRLLEITQILSKYELYKGLTPDKLLRILEALGPTFVKLGQIMSMRSDMLPVAYCKELEKLRTDAEPMPFSQVRQVIEESCGKKLEKLFRSFEEKPLGAASIAQAHKAVLHTGEDVVVKVQRVGIREVMARDIELLRKATGLLKITPVGEVLDVSAVLDELWNTTQDETNFLKEAENGRLFYQNNENVRYVSSPKYYHEITTSRVLVMEYIGGISIADQDKLKKMGYDLKEIGEKLAENYVKQIVDDGFFHADPHPGNLMIRDGQIVWIDMGMMGTVSPRDRKLFQKGILAVTQSDVSALCEVITTIGICKKPINQQRLFRDVETYLNKYGSMDLASMNLGQILGEMMDVAKDYGISMPGYISMLARGAATIEGVLADISGEINFIEIMANHMKGRLLKDFDWRKTLEESAADLALSSRKALALPSLMADAFKLTMKGQTKFGFEMMLTEECRQTGNRWVTSAIIGLIIAALVIGSFIAMTVERLPALWGVPIISWLGLAAACALGAWLFAGLLRRKE